MRQTSIDHTETPILQGSFFFFPHFFFFWNATDARITSHGVFSTRASAADNQSYMYINSQAERQLLAVDRVIALKLTSSPYSNEETY